ncbi:hypothetical protein CEUSTIGMA_g4174.t1 [Chlamydomonas eustigma]|uniref:PDEase domain-containing protein n=1 Tax=Chlamydomonas eustigma TaxID=1157962 RepID=A0A250X0X5_9CHLO|nr:hypothetical protein CEUSTIGMA_g4174.t1 [Chlamydomonas eustigma]|eukprot:GAX76727.1 hypothetical protein CEUSTIGMA_g4174.t1 [Chlamydomonas eustigma]
MLHMITKSSLFKCGIADTALVKLAYVIAATVHDVDHYGLNNDFLVNSRNTLAVIHNDRSPMESHHCSLTFTTLYGPDTDFTALLSPADQKVFRSLVIDLVLATDMKQHFNILSQFTSSSRLGNKKSESGPGPSPLSGNSSTPQPGAVAPPCSGGGPSHLSSPLGLVKRDDSDDKLARRSPAVERGLKKPSLGVTSANVSPRGAMGTLLRLNSLRQVTPVDAVPYHPKNDGEKLVCLQVALKIADVSSIFRPFNVALRSIHGLEEEFFRQGDKERELGMPLTPLFDRTKAGVSKAQKGFIDFIAMPLLKSFVHVFPECQPLLLELKLNYVELEAMNKAIPSPAVDNNSAGIVQEVAEHRHQEVAEHRHQAIGVEKYGQGDEEHFKKDSIKSLLSDHEGTQ